MSAERVDELTAQLRAWDRAYYLQDAPVVDDATYDAALRELRELEAGDPSLVRPDSPTQRVGGGVSGGFSEVRHLFSAGGNLYAIENDGTLYKIDLD